MAVAGERVWYVNDLSAKHDFLRSGLDWGHMPIDLVAPDLKEGKLIELKRRAWHLQPLIFMSSRRRGYQISTSEDALIELLANKSHVLP